MKLLIVEDNSALAELTAELLHSLDAQAKRIETITLAADLQTAMLCLPEHDAVLCDGTFPLSYNSRFLVEDWDVVCHEAQRRGIHFVLYSGSVCALDCARESNTLALAKPAPAAEIYAALTNSPFAKATCKYGHGESTTNDQTLVGAEYETDLRRLLPAVESGSRRPVPASGQPRPL
jgi:CheY-like chemotaxis protein